jgi:hypothetical protein
MEIKIATHKCAAMVIKSTNSNLNFNLKLYNDRILMVEDQTFLGIKIDRYLKFDKHIELLSAKANSRINILKILSHKSWKINISEILQINAYKYIQDADEIDTRILSFTQQRNQE